MRTLSPGVLYLIVGAILLLVASILTIIMNRAFHKKEQELRDQIWKDNS